MHTHSSLALSCTGYRLLLHLWCNPFLVHPHVPEEEEGEGANAHAQVAAAVPPVAELPRHGLELEFGDLAELRTLSTISDALTALQEVRNCPSAAVYQQQIWPFWLQREPRFQDRQAAQEHLQKLVTAIPATWRVAAVLWHVGAAPLPTTDVIVHTYILNRLGWAHPTIADRTIGLSSLMVKKATQLQMQPVVVAREAKHLLFLSEACQGLAHNLQAQPQDLKKLLKGLWRIPWDNQRKEFFWRFTVDGLPTAARMHMFGEPCAVCDHSGPARRHHYWECPVAQAVAQELTRVLAGFGGEPLRCDHVWLARRPHPQLHWGVWVIVCQAALLGMDKGRRLMVAATLGPQQQQRSLHSLPRHARMLVVNRVAVATFWDMLADFVGLGLAPVTWLAEVHTQHPFMGVQIAADGSRSLVLRRV
jgi:hypothetical protein